MHKPRNFVILALSKRCSGSGAHIRSHKAIRKKERQNLQRHLKQAKSENF